MLNFLFMFCTVSVGKRSKGSKDPPRLLAKDMHGTRRRGKASEGSIDSSLVLESVAKKLKGKKCSATVQVDLVLDSQTKKIPKAPKKSKIVESVDLEHSTGPIMEESPSVDLKLAEVRTKIAHDDLKNIKDGIFIDLPVNASVVSGFDEIRGECSKLLFPQDEVSLLSMGDQGLLYYLVKDSLRVSLFIIIYSFSFMFPVYLLEL